MPRSLNHIRREVNRLQARDHKVLRGAVIGRKLTDIHSGNISRHLSRETTSIVTYRAAGQVALVYLFRDELRQHRGKTFFNQQHVANALAKAPVSSRTPARVNRAVLEIVDKPLAVSENGSEHRWLFARALSINRPDSADMAVNVRQEELSIANELFNQKNDSTDSPLLWLGAITSASAADAHDTVEILEDIFPTTITAEPVSLIPYVPFKV